MTLNFFPLIIIIVSLVSLNSCQDGVEEIKTPPASKIRVCGDELLAYLAWTCQGVYGRNGKRSYHSFYDSENTHVFTNNLSKQWPLSSRLMPSFNHSMLKRFQVAKREGVVDKCCHKSCYSTELHAFC